MPPAAQVALLPKVLFHAIPLALPISYFLLPPFHFADMQITIAQVALTGTVPAEDVQDFQFASDSPVQTVSALGAADIALFPRGNKQVTFTFTIQRQHDSAEAAAYFVPSYEAPFPVQGLLTYATAAGTLYMASAVAVVVRASVTGATSTLSYRVTGGGFLQTAPSA